MSQHNSSVADIANQLVITATNALQTSGERAAVIVIIRPLEEGRMMAVKSNIIGNPVAVSRILKEADVAVERNGEVIDAQPVKLII